MLLPERRSLYLITPSLKYASCILRYDAGAVKLSDREYTRGFKVALGTYSHTISNPIIC